MKKSFLSSALALALLGAPLAFGQKFPKGTAVHYPPGGPLAQQQAPALPPLAQRQKQLQDLLGAIRQYRLKTHPEYASTVGDTRYDASLTNYSASAWEQRLNQANAFMFKLAQIDTTGMSAAEKRAEDQMMQALIAQQTAGASRPWETPVTATTGLPFSLAQLPARLHFHSAADYNNYIARLNQVPTAFRQISDDILLGMQDENPPSPAVIRAVLAQVRAITSQQPEDSPFAEPLKAFSASVSAADRARIRKAVLAAITGKVYPAYQRFGRFLSSLQQQPSNPAAAQPHSPSQTPKVQP